MMKIQTERLKRMFVEPRVSYGVFFAGIVLMAAVSFAAIVSGYDRALLEPTPVASLHDAIGETMTAADVAFTVNGFRTDAKGVPGLSPMPGYEFLIPAVTLTNNTGADLEMIPLLYFYIKDSEGNVYHPTAAPIMTDQLTGPILPGETVREEIGFEVPLGIDRPALYFERGTPGHPVVAVDLTDAGASSTTIK
ncbi:MAG: DUF4352 domain-containing protein [Candidatus Pacebacteria bacterium]|nr:DUF4352 domain-containing protein [Candidatus Paceibacterota bacterium]